MLTSLHPVSLAARRGLAGFSLVQVMVATAIIVIVGLASVQALVMMNRKASVMRTFSNARAVVQRNIDTAMGVPYTLALEPPILALTPVTGFVYDDDGGGDNQVNIALL